MEKRNVMPVWATVIMAILCLGVAVYYGFFMVKMIDEISSIAIVNFVVDIIACLAAFIYFVSGYKKNTASFYKTVCIMNAVASFMAVGLCIDFMEGSKWWAANAVLMLVLAVLYFILAFVKDLGRKKSHGIYMVIVMISVVYTIIATIIAPYTIIFSLCMMIVELIFGFMIYGKYKDKEARGRNVG